MTPEFANFAARLREFISSSTPVAADARRLVSANPKSEVGMGGTGDPPVPSGHWPDGTGRRPALETDSWNGSFPNPSGESPIGTGQWPVLPARVATVPSKFGFHALALELFRLQFAHNADYRRICETRRATPEAVTHWMQIPAVPTAAFKEFAMTCLPAAGRTTVFHSSGTSGQRPGRHFHNAASLAVYEASLWPWFRAHVLPDLRFAICDLRVAILTPPLVQAPHSSLVHMFEVVRQACGVDSATFVGCLESDGSWSLDFDAVQRALRGACDAATPLVLLGTAFSFVHLLDDLAEQNLRFQLPSGSRVMETGGYKGRSRSLPRAELHAIITERLGIPPSHIVSEYGMSELSSQAYDSAIWTKPTPDPSQEGNCGGASRVLFPSLGGVRGGSVGAIPRHSPPATRHFHFPPWARVQIISPETGLEVREGETGLIRVFDLANVYSVLAIQTEDLGIRRGDGFELVGRAANAEPRGCSLMAVNS
jgi:hypothetical protein